MAIKNIVSATMQTALETPNDLYSTWLPVWTQAQDIADGSKAVKAKGVAYLPKTSLMEVLANGDDLYDSYKLRANFFNGTGRTVDGLLGLVYRKEPILTAPDVIIDMAKNVNLKNQTFTSFSKKYLEEVILKNRVGLLVDYPVKYNTISTAEATRLNLRPFFVMFKASSILDWDEERINNVYKTSFIMLREVEQKRTDLEVTSVEKRRILDLVQPEQELSEMISRIEDRNPNPEEEIAILLETTPRYYRQRIYIKEEVIAVGETKTNNNESWVLQSEIFPTDIKGNRFTEIPFFVTTDRGISLDLDYSMVYDLSEVNLSLYRNSADLENINHVGSNPTPCAVGLKSTMLSNPNISEKPESTSPTVALGLNTLLEFEEGGSSWMLEPSGNGASSVEAMMRTKKEEMALLGSRILASDPKGVEAVETAQIHQSGEQGVLASAVDAIIETFLKGFAVMYQWQTGMEVPEMKIDISKDFVPGRLSAADVSTAVMAMQQGGLAPSDLFKLLQKGEWIDATKKFEDHEKEIDVMLKKVADAGTIF